MCEIELPTPGLSLRSVFFALQLVLAWRSEVRRRAHHSAQGCCPTYHFVVVMFAVAAVFNVVRSGAFLLTQETRHLSTEHERHTVRLQKQLDGAHAQTVAPGCGLNQLFHLNWTGSNVTSPRTNLCQIPSLLFSRQMLHCKTDRLNLKQNQQRKGNWER